MSPPPINERQGVERQFKLPRNFADIPIIVSVYRLYALFHESLLSFPKSQRYSLGTTCQTELLLLLQNLLGAVGTGDRAAKLGHLRASSRHLDTLKLLFCLARDTRCIPNATYQTYESLLAETGRMLGGWHKSLE